MLPCLVGYLVHNAGLCADDAVMFTRVQREKAERLAAGRAQQLRDQVSEKLQLTSVQEVTIVLHWCPSLARLTQHCGP